MELLLSEGVGSGCSGVAGDRGLRLVFVPFCIPPQVYGKSSKGGRGQVFEDLPGGRAEGLRQGPLAGPCLRHEACPRANRSNPPRVKCPLAADKITTFCRHCLGTTSVFAP